MDQNSDDYLDIAELSPTNKVTNFSQFWDEQESQEGNLNLTSQEGNSTNALQSNINMMTSDILLKSIPGIAFFGLIGYSGGTKSKEDAIREFSQEVSNYSVSKEVIVQLSNEIGPPHGHENEDQFVERAKRVLKQILKKKFFL